MAEGAGITAERVISIIYVALVAADIAVVADIISGGNLHRWWTRRTRALYRWASDPFQREAEVRRQASWVVWEAMQLLEEDAARP